MSLEGKVAVVTGSSSGIGEATARSLARAGASVVINSSSSVAAGQAVADSLPGARYVQADIAEDAACEAQSPPPTLEQVRAARHPGE